MCCADLHFPGALQIVDLFHARQHLWDLARLLYPGDDAHQKQSTLRHPTEKSRNWLLTGLDAGDLLFVDSTHAMRPGSEVNRIILEVLPCLPSGSFVHFHDIYFPYDYQSAVLTTLFFAGESTLLHAFLIYNQRYSIAVSLSMLHHACPQQIQSLLPNYRPAVMHYGLHTMGEGSGHFPSATYLSVL